MRESQTAYSEGSVEQQKKTGSVQMDMGYNIRKKSGKKFVTSHEYERADRIFRSNFSRDRVWVSFLRTLSFFRWFLYFLLSVDLSLLIDCNFQVALFIMRTEETKETFMCMYGYMGKSAGEIKDN